MNTIENLNKEIPYEDGKIYWEANKGYTSNTMKYLYKCGYYVTISGCIHTLYDMEYKKVTFGYSWEDLLFNTAIAMR